MNSITTLIFRSLFLFWVGFRRMYSSFSLYLKDPSFYESKPWFFIDQNWKNLDFYALLVALPMILLSDIVVLASFSGHPSYKFGFLQHGTLNFLFWVLLIVILFRESFDFFTINEGFVYVLAGICFFVEYFMNWSHFSEISGHVYDFLGHLTLVCAFSCLYLSIRHTAFLADFCLSSGLMFKGTWVLQAGLNMYTHTFGLKGCQTISSLPNQYRVEIKCDLVEDGLRGIALINLLFVFHAIMVFITCFGFFGLLSCKEVSRYGESAGPLLGGIESHSMLLQPLPEFEI